MTRMFAPRLDALPESQRELWPSLAPLAGTGLVLHGGTAIVLRLGHRVSIDFDFFTDRPLERASLQNALPVLRDAITIQDEPNSYSVIVSMGTGPVRLSFFGGIQFGRIGLPELTADGVAIAASLEDLFAQKLKVVMQRVEAKDYQDIAAVLRSGMSLELGLGGALALFGNSFAPAECARALVHFKGGDLSRLSQEDRQTLLTAVRGLGYRIPPLPKLSESLAP